MAEQPDVLTDAKELAARKKETTVAELTDADDLSRRMAEALDGIVEDGIDLRDVITGLLPVVAAEVAEAKAELIDALDPCMGGEEQHARHVDVCVPFHDRAAALMDDDTLDALDRLRIARAGSDS